MTDENNIEVKFFRYSYQDLKRYLETETDVEKLNIINKLNDLHNDNEFYDRHIKHNIRNNYIKEDKETLDRYIEEKGKVLEQIKHYENLLNI